MRLLLYLESIKFCSVSFVSGSLSIKNIFDSAAVFKLKNTRGTGQQGYSYLHYPHSYHPINSQLILPRAYNFAKHLTPHLQEHTLFIPTLKIFHIND